MNERLFKIFALMLTLTLAFALPTSAFAEDDVSSSSSSASATAEPATSVDTNPENIVDPTQRADNSFIYDTTIEDVLARHRSTMGALSNLSVKPLAIACSTMQAENTAG